MSKPYHYNNAKQYNSDLHNFFFLLVFQESRKTNRRTRNSLYHDNAISHISTETTTFLRTPNIDSPPYSPYLAPNDFFLFWYEKNKGFQHLKRRLILSELMFGDTSVRVAKMCFNNWFKCMQMQ